MVKGVYLLFFIMMFASSVSAVGLDNPNLPLVRPNPTTFDNSTAFVNNSYYLRGYSPTELRDLFQLTYDTLYCKLTGCTMTSDINMVVMTLQMSMTLQLRMMHRLMMS